MARTNAKSNIANVNRNSRVKIVKSVKDSLMALEGTLEAEISKLNSNAMRPIHRANDLAGRKIGQEYLNAPEHAQDENTAWAQQLARLMQDVKQLQRRVMRTEQMAKAK